jgi:hypothetical protein
VDGEDLQGEDAAESGPQFAVTQGVAVEDGGVLQSSVDALTNWNRTNVVNAMVPAMMAGP